MTKRKAQAWALIIAENVYAQLRAGQPLPFRLPGPALPKGLCTRTIQEVGMAKKQIDQLEAVRAEAQDLIPWSLRWGPREEPEPGEVKPPARSFPSEPTAPHFSLIVDRPASSRRVYSSRMMDFALGTRGSSVNPPAGQSGAAGVGLPQSNLPGGDGPSRPVLSPEALAIPGISIQTLDPLDPATSVQDMDALMEQFFGTSTPPKGETE